MVTYFEEQTADLNEYERDVLLPVMAMCLARHKGKKNVITNKKMCEAMKEKGYSIGEVRIRKIINYIRVMDIVKYLIGTGKGYYVAESQSEMIKYIKSLRERIAAIHAVQIAMERQLEEMETIPS